MVSPPVPLEEQLNFTDPWLNLVDERIWCQPKETKQKNRFPRK